MAVRTADIELKRHSFKRLGSRRFELRAEIADSVHRDPTQLLESTGLRGFRHREPFARIHDSHLNEQIMNVA